MSYQVLARKWRPQTFQQVVGQTHVLRALVNALDSDRLHHAYLFTGTRGVGKTSLARVFAKSLNCEKGVTSQPCGECGSCIEVDEGRFVDLIEVDAASRTKVDETRELLDNVQYAATRGRYKVYLIDEVHMFSTHSFNALLKTLEEPPPHVKFLLATTDPKKLPVTILSRCLQFNLKRVPLEQLVSHLTMIIGEEGVSAEPDAVAQLAKAADGSVRDALSLLDQAIAYGAGDLSNADVSTMLGTIAGEEIVGLVDALITNDGTKMITLARQLAEVAPDYQYVLGELLSYLRRIAVVQALEGNVDGIEDSADVKRFAESISGEEVQLFYQIGLIGRRDLSLAPEAQAGFEMVLLRMLAFQPDDGSRSRIPRKLKRDSTPVSEQPNPVNAASGGESVAPRSRVNTQTEQASPSVDTQQSQRARQQRPAEPQSEREAVREATPRALPSHGPSHKPSHSSPNDARRDPDPSHNDSYEALTASRDEVSANGSSPGELNIGIEERAAPKPQIVVGAELDWHSLVSQLSLHGLVRELARNANLSNYAGNLLELVVEPKNENLKAERLIKGLEDALAEQANLEVQIRLAVADGVVDTVAHRLSAEEQAKQRQAEERIAEDPTVQTLQSEFGATIESVSPR